MNRTPSLPRLLGYAGLLPQLACLAGLLRGGAEWRYAALALGTAYASLILSFLGGAWWGLAAAAPAAERRQSLGWLWFASVVPSLLALAAWVPWVFGLDWPEPSLMMLGAALVLSLAVDAKLGPLAPPWWMGLRVPLSLGLGTATMALAFLAPVAR
ncbi:MAG: DUF3429 domain-containing protein [Rhodobacteraceae bacterium]|nr:DUF3429 domain-containing protein [Paracoccaceae bacterium]